MLDFVANTCLNLSKGPLHFCHLLRFKNEYIKCSLPSSHRPVQAPLAKSGAATLNLKEAECGVCLDTLEEVGGSVTPNH